MTIASADSAGSSDDHDVERAGYRPELPRTFGLFASFAVGFSFISVTSGVFASFGLGLATAGGYMTWTWPLVALGQTLVALVFGMLATRVPLAGSSYQWVSRMTNPTIGWLQGWSFLTFVVISLLTVNYTLASTIVPALFGYTGTVDNTLLVSALITILQALILIFSTALAGRINNMAVVSEIVGTVGLSVVLIVVVAIHHGFHFGNLFTPNPGHQGSFTAIGGLFHSGWWQLALLMGIYSLCGFEGCADMAEETANAERHVPRAMWVSMVISGVLGCVFIGALVASAPNLGALVNSSTPVADILNEALGGVVGRLFLVVVMFSVFACGLIIFMDTTRITYAMARDERLPGWKLLRRVSPKLATPLSAVVAVGVLDLVLLFTFGRSASALSTIVGVTSVLPPIMYGGPVVIALFRRKRLAATANWTLGRWETPVNVLAALFILLELFTLRDSSLAQGWLYVCGAAGIGALYLIYRRVTRGPMPALGALDPAAASTRRTSLDDELVGEV